jgi:hypothetical protein
VRLLNIIIWPIKVHFFAPVGNNQEKAIRKYADKNGETNLLTSNFSWVGLATDNLGYVYAPAPMIPSDAKTAANKWAVYSDSNGALQARHVASTLHVETSSAQGAVLFHSLRFKGVEYVNATSPMGDQGLRFICRKKTYPHNVFISEARSVNMSDGDAKCNDEDGYFLPPLTTGGWEKALHLVKSNHSMHAFPIVSAESPTFYDPAWVALELGAGEQMYSSGILSGVLSGSSTNFIDGSGAFISVDESDETVSFDYLCFDESNYEFVVRASACSGTKRYLSSTELSAMTASDNRYLKMLLAMTLKDVTDSDKLKLAN